MNKTKLKFLCLLACVMLGAVQTTNAAYQCSGNNILSNVSFARGDCFYAPGWVATNDYTAIWANNKFSIQLGYATSEIWQAQFRIACSSQPLIAGKTYFISYDIETNVALPRALMKVHTIGNDNAFIEILSSIPAGKTTVSGISVSSANAFNVILFDFGGNPANANITISNILICDGYSENTAGYHLVWEDNFDKAQLDESVWNIEVDGGGGGNNELQYYRRENVSVGIEPVSGKSCLILKTKKENFGGRTVTSGRVNTMSKMNFKYGKIEGRIKLPPGANGLWPAFWMLGDDFSTVGWPKCGEIDIMEMGHAEGITKGTQNRFFGGHFHWGEQWPQPNWGLSHTWEYNLQDDFHLWTMTWDENSIKMYLDQDKYPAKAPFLEMNINKSGGVGQNQVGRYFHKPFFVLLNMAVGGNLPNIFNINQVTALNAVNNYETKMYVDYIKVYQRGDNGEEFYLNSGTGLVTAVTNQLQIFPTPVKDELFIKSDLQIEKVEIFSLTGNLLILENHFTGQISVSSLPKGIYFVTVKTEKTIVTEKFIKE